MQIPSFFTVMLMSVLLITLSACRNGSTEGEHEAEGEESGPQLSRDEIYDAVRKGVRLVLVYNSTSSSFVGTVENVTDQAVPSVRVEVHLSNGTELGPTSAIDLAPGSKASVNLSAAGQSFSWWKAHAETGGSGDEHEGGAEHAGEHESRGEHGDEHEGGREHGDD
jgi:hypothetical protein